MSYTQSSFAVAAQEVVTRQSQEVTFSSSGQPGSLAVSFNMTDNATAAITIPGSVLVGLNSTEYFKITHALFVDNRLFINSQSEEQLGSVVLATSIAGGYAVKNLTENVRILFKKNMVGSLSVYIYKNMCAI